jgi:hypothetical protein
VNDCRAERWKGHPLFEGDHEPHAFWYGPGDRYQGHCGGSGGGALPSGGNAIIGPRIGQQKLANELFMRGMIMDGQRMMYPKRWSVR